MQELIINYKMPTLNEYVNAERTNKYIAAKLKKESTQYCMYEAMKQIKNIKTPAVFEFTWIEKNKKRDPDNISFAQKFVFDGLVEANRMNNDGHKDVKGIIHKYDFRDYIGLELKIHENGEW